MSVLLSAHRDRLAALAVGVFHHDRFHADPDDPVLPEDQLPFAAVERQPLAVREDRQLLPARRSIVPMNFSGIGGGGGGGGGVRVPGSAPAAAAAPRTCGGGGGGGGGFT